MFSPLHTEAAYYEYSARDGNRRLMPSLDEGKYRFYPVLTPHDNDTDGFDEFNRLTDREDHGEEGSRPLNCINLLQVVKPDTQSSIGYVAVCRDGGLRLPSSRIPRIDDEDELIGNNEHLIGVTINDPNIKTYSVGLELRPWGFDAPSFSIHEMPVADMRGDYIDRLPELVRYVLVQPRTLCVVSGTVNAEQKPLALSVDAITAMNDHARVSGTGSSRKVKLGIPLEREAALLELETNYGLHLRDYWPEYAGLDDTVLVSLPDSDSGGASCSREEVQ